MIRREVRTGFEWLDTPLLITRILVTLWGALMAFLLFCATVAVVDDLRTRIFPPAPKTEWAGDEGEIVTRTHCFADRTPYRDLSIGFWISAMPIAGMVLVWRKPKIGFLLSAGGWFMIALIAGVGPEAREWRHLALGLLPPLWLCFAARKVRPSPPPSPDLVIPVEDPETGFEWMDSIFEWLMAPFRLVRGRRDGDPSL
jgi:hypothetical protein